VSAIGVEMMRKSAREGGNVCVCERERERKRWEDEREREKEREREREREKKMLRNKSRFVLLTK
jgi:hypothetical protein